MEIIIEILGIIVLVLIIWSFIVYTFTPIVEKRRVENNPPPPLSKRDEAEKEFNRRLDAQADRLMAVLGAEEFVRLLNADKTLEEIEAIAARRKASMNKDKTSNHSLSISEAESILAEREKRRMLYEEWEMSQIDVKSVSTSTATELAAMANAAEWEREHKTTVNKYEASNNAPPVQGSITYTDLVEELASLTDEELRELSAELAAMKRYYIYGSGPGP
jgi:hypothetical protein